MKPEVYPLQAARELRERAVEAAQQALAQAVRDLEGARAAEAEAADALRAHQDETQRFRARDTAAGARSMAEVLRGQAYLERRRSEEAALTEGLDVRRREVDAAGRAVEEARAALASARAEHEAVEKHHAGWLAERRKRRLAREEEEAEERRR